MSSVLRAALVSPLTLPPGRSARRDAHGKGLVDVDRAQSGLEAAQLPRRLEALGGPINSIETNDWTWIGNVAIIGLWAREPCVETSDEKGMHMGTIIIVVLVVLLLGGGGFWYRGRRA